MSKPETKRVDELAVLQNTMKALLESGLDLPQVLDKIVEGVVEGLGYKAAMLAVCEGEGEERVLRATSYAGINPILLTLGQFILRIKLVGHAISLYLPHNLGAQAARAERHSITHDLYDLWRPEVGRFACRVLQWLQGIKTLVTIPFLSKGKLVGNLFAGTERSEITDSEIELLRSFADQAAIAIENASQHSKAEERLKQVEILQSNIAALLEATTDRTQVLQHIIDSVVSGLGYKYAMLAVHDEETSSLRLTHWAGIPERLRAFGEWLAGTSFEGGVISLKDHPDNWGVKAAKAQEPRITHDLYDLWRPVIKRWHCWIFQRLARVRTLVTIPFVSRGKLVGNLFAGSEKGEISQENIKTLSAFANQAAIAIENAQLYERQKQLADEMQQLAEERQRLYEQAEKGRIDGLKVSMMATLSNLILHDLNSELGKIRLLTGDQKVQQKVDTVLNMIERLTAPVKEEMEIEPTDLNASVASVLADVRVEIPQNIEIVEDFASDLPRVQASAHITEIFRILIKNAVEAMEEGGILTIRTGMAEEDGRAEVLVADTGRGIRKEDMRKLFDPKFTTKGEKRSLGVGLYLAKNFLDMMNGEIKVESKVGDGATFTVNLLADAGKEAIRE
jgi:signal transduction histidine kinase